MYLIDLSRRMEFEQKSAFTKRFGKQMAERKYNPAARRIAIQAVLMREGTVSVETLAEQFGASVATIRRDLSALEEAGVA